MPVDFFDVEQSLKEDVQQRQDASIVNNYIEQNEDALPNYNIDQKKRQEAYDERNSWSLKSVWDDAGYASANFTETFFRSDIGALIPKSVLNSVGLSDDDIDPEELREWKNKEFTQSDSMWSVRGFQQAIFNTAPRVTWALGLAGGTGLAFKGLSTLPAINTAVQSSKILQAVPYVSSVLGTFGLTRNQQVRDFQDMGMSADEAYWYGSAVSGVSAMLEQGVGLEAGVRKTLTSEIGKKIAYGVKEGTKRAGEGVGKAMLKDTLAKQVSKAGVELFSKTKLAQNIAKTALKEGFMEEVPQQFTEDLALYMQSGDSKHLKGFWEYANLGLYSTLVSLPFGMASEAHNMFQKTMPSGMADAVSDQMLGMQYEDIANNIEGFNEAIDSKADMLQVAGFNLEQVQAIQSVWRRGGAYLSAQSGDETMAFELINHFVGTEKEGQFGRVEVTASAEATRGLIEGTEAQFEDDISALNKKSLNELVQSFNNPLDLAKWFNTNIKEKFSGMMKDQMLNQLADIYELEDGQAFIDEVNALAREDLEVDTSIPPELDAVPVTEPIDNHQTKLEGADDTQQTNSVLQAEWEAEVINNNLQEIDFDAMLNEENVFDPNSEAFNALDEETARLVQDAMPLYEQVVAMPKIDDVQEGADVPKVDTETGEQVSDSQNMGLEQREGGQIAVDDIQVTEEQNDSQRIINGKGALGSYYGKTRFITLYDDVIANEANQKGLDKGGIKLGVYFHEFAHDFMKFVPETEQANIARILSNGKIAKLQGGLSKGEYDTISEAFAESFTSYLSTLDADPALKPVFNQLHGYQQALGSYRGDIPSFFKKAFGNQNVTQKDIEEYMKGWDQGNDDIASDLLQQVEEAKVDETTAKAEFDNATTEDAKAESALAWRKAKAQRMLMEYNLDDPLFKQQYNLPEDLDTPENIEKTIEIIRNQFGEDPATTFKQVTDAVGAITVNPQAIQEVLNALEDAEGIDVNDARASRKLKYFIRDIGLKTHGLFADDQNFITTVFDDNKDFGKAWQEIMAKLQDVEEIKAGFKNMMNEKIQGMIDWKDSYLVDVQNTEILPSGQKYNVDAMLKAWLWLRQDVPQEAVTGEGKVIPKYRTQLMQANKMTEADIKFIEDFFNKKENAGLRSLGEAMSQNLQNLFPMLNAVHKNVTGKELQFVTNYFPTTSEDSFMFNNNGEALFDKTAVWNPHSGLATEQATHKHRTTKASPMRLQGGALSTYESALQSAVHYITHAQTVKDIHDVFNTAENQQLMMDKFGTPTVLERVNTMLQDRMSPNGRSKPLGWGEDAIRKMRSRFVESMLVGRLKTIARQPASFVNAMPFMSATLGAQYWGSVAMDSIKNVSIKDNAHYKRMIDHFPTLGERYPERAFVEMRTALKDPNSSVMKDIKRLAEKGDIPSMLKIIRTGVGYSKNKALSMITWMDAVTVTAVYNSAYETAISEGQSDKDAKYFARNVIRQTQPSTGVTELAPILKQNEWLRATVGLFSNQMNRVYQQTFTRGINPIMADIYQGKSAREIGGKMWDSKSRYFNTAFYAIALPATMMSLISRGRLPQDRKEGEEMLWDIALYPMQTVPFANNFVYAVTSGRNPSETLGGSLYQMVGDTADGAYFGGKRLAQGKNPTLGQFYQFQRFFSTMAGMPDFANQMFKNWHLKEKGDNKAWTDVMINTLWSRKPVKKDKRAVFRKQ